MSRKLSANAKAWVPSSAPAAVPDPPPQYSGSLAPPPQYDYGYDRGEEIPPPPADFVASIGETSEFPECLENWDDEVRRVHNDAQLRPQYETEDGAVDGYVDPMALWSSSLEVIRDLIEEQLEEEAAYQRSVTEKFERLRQEKLAEKNSHTHKKSKQTDSRNGSSRVPDKPRRESKEKQPKEKQPISVAAKKAPLDTLTQALLNSASPFMGPLRQRCGTSLPHLKLDQRFGKKATEAVAQFIIAPVVANYKPRHLHEVTPGDLMEFHHDFALVLKVIKSASTVCVNYGPEWKPHAIPFVYLTCAEFEKEVTMLCPEEKVNVKAIPQYSDDVFKDVSSLILAIPELEVLRHQSFSRAMLKRTNLTPLYHVLNELFSPLGNYQLQIKDLTTVPSRFIVRCSSALLREVPRPIVIAGDEDLWNELPLEGPSNNDEKVVNQRRTALAIDQQVSQNSDQQVSQNSDQQVSQDSAPSSKEVEIDQSRQTPMEANGKVLRDGQASSDSGLFRAAILSATFVVASFLIVAVARRRRS